MLPLVGLENIWTASQEMVPRVARDQGITEISIDTSRSQSRVQGVHIDPEMRANKSGRRCVFKQWTRLVQVRREDPRIKSQIADAQVGGGRHHHIVVNPIKVERLSHFTAAEQKPAHHCSVVRADNVVAISFRRPPTYQRRVRRIASKDVLQLILPARRRWQTQQDLAVLELQVICAGVALQHVAHERHVVAVKLPGAEICHGTVIIRPDAFEAVGVNEIGGQTICAGKRRNAEFDRRSRQIGVLGENRVKQRTRDGQFFNLESIEEDAEERMRNGGAHDFQFCQRAGGSEHRRCCFPIHVSDGIVHRSQNIQKCGAIDSDCRGGRPRITYVWIPRVSKTQAIWISGSSAQVC